MLLGAAKKRGLMQFSKKRFSAEKVFDGRMLTVSFAFLQDGRLRKGDQLIAVDNQPIVGLTHAEVNNIKWCLKVVLVVMKQTVQFQSPGEI